MIYHSISAAPVRRFTDRAITNSRSESRLMYRISTASGAGLSDTIRRSARRHTARET
jgi:hypothetical protein